MRVYTRLPPVETSGQGFSPRLSHRLPAALFRVLKACRLGIPNQLFQTTLRSWTIAESFSWVPQPRLSRRKRQPIDPPQHIGKQPPRQITLRQQQPIIAGMFHQPAARLHQPLLETRQRPAPDPLRQNQPPPKVAEIIGNDGQPQPYFIRAESFCANTSVVCLKSFGSRTTYVTGRLIS